MDFNGSGRALAIGKVSTQDEVFDVSLRTIFNEPLDVSGISNFRNYVNFYEIVNFYNPAILYGDTTISGERIVFESGSWIPNVGSKSGISPTSSTQYVFARYKRINNICYVTFHGKWYISNAGTDYACITGLPYVSVGGLNGQSLVLHEMSGAITMNPTRVGVVPDSSSMIELLGENGSYACQWQTGDVWVGFSGFYLIAT